MRKEHSYLNCESSVYLKLYSDKMQISSMVTVSNTNNYILVGKKLQDKIKNHGHQINIITFTSIFLPEMSLELNQQTVLKPC